jgi:pimeloyl-ACP methyl ester carboxylesterase
VSSRLVEFTGHEGLRLEAEAWGDPGGRPVLLLHGGGQTRHAWGETAQHIADGGWWAVSLDLRGHGASDWSPAADYSADANVEDVRLVTAELNEPPLLVGASLGGQASLLAEGETSGGIATGLVLVDIAPRVELEGVTRIVAFMREHLDGFSSLEKAAEAVRAYLPERAAPPTAAGLEKNLRRGEDGRWRWHWDPRLLENQLGPAVGNPELLRSQAKLWGERMVTAARAVHKPTLLVRGRLSDVISQESVAEFRTAVPHAEYVDVSDAGHMVAGDRNDVFTAAVIDFLERWFPAGS